MNAEADAREQAAERSRWQDVVYTRIKNAWLRPPGLPEGLKCDLSVRILGTGEVIRAEVQQSSGNRLFDDSALSAVNKASPLPVPPPGVRGELVFEFNPDNS